MIPFPGSCKERKAHANQNTAFLVRFTAGCLVFGIPDKCCRNCFDVQKFAMTTPDLDQLSTWQFELPPELIAARPATRRDDSRLLVVDRESGTLEHSHIRELPSFLDAQDLLVFNNTQVLPARLFGFRTATQGRWEGLFVEQSAVGEWTILCETRGRLTPGETITVLRAYGELAGDDMDHNHQPPPSELLLTLKQKLEDGMLLRVGVTGGGCSGFSYALGFDKSFDDKADSKYDCHGVTVVVDKKSALYLDGTTVDFYDGLEKRGFTFENPNAVKTCGCGSSFQA